MNVPTVDSADPLYGRLEGTDLRNACVADADCFAAGCGGEICSAEQDVFGICDGVAPPAGACGCVLGECIWSRRECIGPCPDADGDSRCDEVDPECNADGSERLCRRLPPACEAGTVPEVRDGCYTDQCLTWQQCAEGEVGACRAHADCLPGQACVDGFCRAADCSPIRPGEYGPCDALVGFGVDPVSGQCVAISGCSCDESCDGRVFPTLEECQRACAPPPP